MVIYSLAVRATSLALGTKSWRHIKIVRCASRLANCPYAASNLNKSKKKMSGDGVSDFQTFLDAESKRLAPSLTVKGNYKGASGKIGVIGGSFEYTGAPYFASISALKVGADLVHVFCTKEAAVPIKTYSPELIVHPLLEECGFDEMTDWLKRMDVILVGCGLGRAVETMQLLQKILAHLKELHKPVVLDADALYLIMQKPNLLVGFESNVILTPNRMELARIVGVTNPVAISDEDVKRMIVRNNWSNQITVFIKAANDEIYNKDKKVTLLNMGGSGRRCGGQGDILGGSLAVFLHWSHKRGDLAENAPFVACYAASKLTRQCNHRAFIVKGRSMTATDMIDHIHDVFDMHFELPITQ